jgi:hypothetical protein
MAARKERRRDRTGDEHRRRLGDLQIRWESEDSRRRYFLDQVRRARAGLEQQRFSPEQARRRAEDRIREEHQDAHAVTIKGGNSLPPSP